MAEGNFIDDKPDGIVKVYNEQGQLMSETTFKNGEIVEQKEIKQETQVGEDINSDKTEVSETKDTEDRK